MQIKKKTQTEPLQALFCGSFWIDWKFVTVQLPADEHKLWKKNQLPNKQESSLGCYQKRSGNYNKPSKASHIPQSILISYVTHLYWPLCEPVVSILRDWRQKEPSNLALMQFQLRRHCSHSLTIKLWLQVPNAISFIIPVPGLGGVLTKYNVLLGKRSRSLLDDEDLFSIWITLCECDMS